MNNNNNTSTARSYLLLPKSYPLYGALVKIGNIYRWIYGRIIGKPTNFNWLILNNNKSEA